jgi:hypothetical protein
VIREDFMAAVDLGAARSFLQNGASCNSENLCSQISELEVSNKQRCIIESELHPECEPEIVGLTRMMRTFYSFFSKLILLFENLPFSISFSRFVKTKRFVKRGTFPSCCGALVKFVF